MQLRLSVARSVEAVEDVGSYIAGEEDRLLLHDSDLLVVPFGIKCLNIYSVEEDSALCRLIKLLNERDDWALTAARVADESNYSVFVVVNSNRYILQDLDVLVLGVRKIDMLNLKIALDLTWGFKWSFLWGGHIYELFDTVRCRVNLEKWPQVQRKHHNVRDHWQQQEEELHKIARWD